MVNEYEYYDVVVVGGGVNGIGIVMDVVGCGLKVFLCEMNDLVLVILFFSSKLIYGGFCYLEYYEF